ncbi:MAG: hypothetical protein A4E51_01668 [Methanosaeta sp. PtaU1.Bin055]|nr:MAG: hypothetical protein A4E51_01668 [Methanosaeta sp. PtaU1.Bin055]
MGSDLVFELRRHRPLPDPGHVRLDDPDDVIHPRGPDAQIGAGAPRRRKRRGDELLGPVDDVQECSLSPFGQDLFAGVEGDVDLVGDVGDVLLQGAADIEVLAEEGGVSDDRWVTAEVGYRLLLRRRDLRELRLQEGEVGEVLHLDLVAAELVDVGVTDTPLRRPDLLLPAALPELVEGDVVGHDDRGLRVDPDVGPYAFGPERLELGPEDFGVQNYARSDEEPRPEEDAAGGEVELVGPIPHDDGVAGVVPALEPDDYVVLLSQEIDDLPLPLVPKLRAGEYGEHDLDQSPYGK